MLQIVFYGPTVGMDLAYSYGPAVETGPGLLQVNGIFPWFLCFKVLFYSPNVGTDLAYTFGPTV